MTHDGSRRDILLAVVHGVLLLVVVATGLYDLAIADVSGLYISSLLILPLVVAVVGFARHRRGRRDGRGMMAAADASVLITVVLYAQLGRSFGPDRATLAIALLIVLTVAGLVTVAIAKTPPGRVSIVRSAMQRRGLVAYALIGPLPGLHLSSGAELPLATMLFVAMPVVAHFALISMTWWWGVRWPMVLASIGLFVTVPLSAGVGRAWPSIAIAVGLGVLGLALAARPPRTGDESRPATAEASPEPSAAAVAWALIGSILLVPSLLIGPLAPRLIDCFDCPPPSPLAGPSIDIDLAALVLLPILAIGVTVVRGRGSRSADRLAWAGLLASALVLGQALLSIGRVPGFEFSLPVAPAAAIATLGFGSAIARPAFVIGVGPGTAVLAALAGTAWMTGTAVPGSAPPDFAAIQTTTLATGMAVTLLLGREFAIGAAAVVAAPPPILDEEPDEVPEAIETSAVTVSVRRR